MTAKSARITILGTPEFKDWLTAEAANEGLSVSELVRRRVTGRESEAGAVDERLLAELMAALREGTRRAEASLDRGIERAETVLAELRSSRA